MFLSRLESFVKEERESLKAREDVWDIGSLAILAGDICGWIICHKVGIIVSSKSILKSLTFDMEKALFQICEYRQEQVSARTNEPVNIVKTMATGWEDGVEFHSASFFYPPIRPDRVSTGRHEYFFYVLYSCYNSISNAKEVVHGKVCASSIQESCAGW